MAKIRLFETVRGDWPIGHMFVAYAGVYDEGQFEVNPQGAVSVKIRDGSLLGVKPDEFEWLREDQ
jgi:hypothetical protein